MRVEGASHETEVCRFTEIKAFPYNQSGKDPRKTPRAGRMSLRMPQCRALPYHQYLTAFVATEMKMELAMLNNKYINIYTNG